MVQDLLLGIPGIAPAGFTGTYQLRDEFITADPAPIATPRTCEPGPGTLNITDTTNSLGISGGIVTPVAQTNALHDPLVISSASLSRVTGRTLKAKIQRVNALGSVATYCMVGWGISATPNTGIYGVQMGGNANQRVYNVGASLTLTDTYAYNTYYDYAIVLRATGAYTFIDGNLAWADPVGNVNTLWPAVYAFVNASYPFQMDYFRVADLTGAFATDTIWTLNQASPGNGTNYTGDADGIYHLTITAPGTLANQTELRCRVLDGSNYTTVYFDAAGALKLDTVVAGTPTNRINVAGAITTGATRTLAVITNGSKLNVYMLNGSSWAKQGSEVNVSNNDTQPTLQAQIGAGWSVSNLRSWARSSPAYAQIGAM